MKMTTNKMLMTLTTFHDGKMMKKMMKDDEKRCWKNCSWCWWPMTKTKTMKTMKMNMTPMTHLDPYAFSMPLPDFSALFITPPLLVRNWGQLHFLLPVDVTHQTRLVQWTWDVLSIRDYPGASDECDPHSSHPLYENPLRWRRIPKEMTILRRAMTAWCLADITPPRTSWEAEETKEKWKRKIQIMFLVPSVKFRHPMPAFWLVEYLIRFWSYQAHDYTVTKPRTWPTCWSSSDENQLSSHGDIHPAIQTFISLVTMEPTSLLACYSAIAADHNYTLLKGQPLSQLPETSWYFPSLPAPPIPFVLGQHVLLLSLPSCIFFGCLRSIIRLERSYLVVTVSPEPTAYGPCLLHPCQVFLPISFMMLPRLWRIQHTYLTHLLVDEIYERFSAYIPSLEHW